VPRAGLAPEIVGEILGSLKDDFEDGVATGECARDVDAIISGAAAAGFGI
jgi:hypothetical protein